MDFYKEYPAHIVFLRPFLQLSAPRLVQNQ